MSTKLVVPELSERELDAAVAEHVMRLQVLGVATCTHIEGEWDVSTTWNRDSHWATQQPVYVDQLHAPDCQICNEPASDCFGEFQGHNEHGLRVVPFYSTDAAAAMQVVEKLTNTTENEVMKTLGFAVFTAHRYPDGRYRASFNGRNGGENTALSSSLPEAICRAALKAHNKEADPDGIPES